MGRRYHVDLGLEAPVPVEVMSDDGVRAQVKIGDGDDARVIQLSLQELAGQRALCTTSMGSDLLEVRHEGQGKLWLVGRQSQARAHVVDERDTWLGSSSAGGGDSVITVAMPGRVVAVDVEQGDAVERGQRILVIEAMKMENDVKAPRDGRIRSIRVAPGDAVDAGQPLVELDQ